MIKWYDISCATLYMTQIMVSSLYNCSWVCFMHSTSQLHPFTKIYVYFDATSFYWLTFACPFRIWSYRFPFYFSLTVVSAVVSTVIHAFHWRSVKKKTDGGIDTVVIKTRNSRVSWLFPYEPVFSDYLSEVHTNTILKSISYFYKSVCAAVAFNSFFKDAITFVKFWYGMIY